MLRPSLYEVNFFVARLERNEVHTVYSINVNKDSPILKYHDKPEHVPCENRVPFKCPFKYIYNTRTKMYFLKPTRKINMIELFVRVDQMELISNLKVLLLTLDSVKFF